MNFKTLFSSSKPDDQAPVLNQRAIDDNQAIHEAIIELLKSAKTEILIAAAWFTDEDLFDAVKNCADEGIKIEIILANNHDNTRLPFDVLPTSLVSIYRVSNSGSGMMHHKFCVVDKTTALHGSYNWTYNARQNNSESVILTNHDSTVKKLIETFNELKEVAKQQSQQHLFADVNASQDGVNNQMVSSQSDPFSGVLDSMIAAEVAGFDRSLLRQQGFDRAKSNNGDHQILPQALDTVYSMFINDIDVMEDKKRRLLSKVEEQKLKAMEADKEQTDLKINQQAAEAELKKQQAASSIVNNDSAIAINVESINQHNRKAQSEQDQIAKLDADIKEQQLAFIQPRHRWFELIPLASFGMLLLSYLFIFYSSAAYIMIYSASDAESNMEIGYVQLPEVFNPQALSSAWDKGFVAFLFVSTFVLVPLALSVLSRIANFSKKEDKLTWVAIILVDGVIAYQVASVVHRVMELRGDILEKWHFSKIFFDTNFYLVLILGALGLFLFKFVYGKFIGYFEDRNPDHAALKSRELIRQHESGQQKCQENIRQLADDSGVLEQKNILLRAENQLLQAEIEETPISLSRAKEELMLVLSQKNQHTQQTTDIYISHIENDSFPISLNALKDRINIFLEGWNDFLHREYSIAKATEMSQAATNSVDDWQNNKIITQKLDHRVS
ncbi:phospholipase D-like domain-containing protein [Sphingobacterium corticis]|uniref:phospholipase D n=1 Tax=Sphingobacterium corticis TaxID=1812823 RepID=A0ABW5NJA1_9SPHI